MILRVRDYNENKEFACFVFSPPGRFFYPLFAIDTLFIFKKTLWINQLLSITNSLIYSYCTIFIGENRLIYLHIHGIFLNDNLLIISRPVEVTDSIRFLGNKILFRFLTGLDSWGLLNLFASFRLFLSKNTGKFLITI